MYKYFNFVFFYPTLQVIGVKRFADRLSITTFCIKINRLFLYYIMDNVTLAKAPKFFNIVIAVIVGCMARSKHCFYDNTDCIISTLIKSNLSLYSLYDAEAWNEFAGPISASLRPGNPASCEQMPQRWKAVSNSVSDLTGSRFEPQTSRSRDERVSAR